MSKTYSEKLRDPRWQKKRLEILERDGWACQMCYDDTTCLHVHHKRYIKGREPWDCCDSMLVALCENCHKIETDADRSECEHDIILMLRDWLFASELKEFTHAMSRVTEVESHGVVVDAICKAICDPELQQILVDGLFQLLAKRHCDNNVTKGN